MSKNRLKKEDIVYLNETANIKLDEALWMIDGVNMLSDIEYGLICINMEGYRLAYWEDGILKDAYKNCED